jgi:hypothetical protein
MAEEENEEQEEQEEEENEVQTESARYSSRMDVVGIDCPLDQ